MKSTNLFRDALESNYLGDIARDRRRRFLGATIAGTAGLPLPFPATAADRLIHDLRGNVKINGKPATFDSVIVAGDTVTTGSDGYLVFVIGNSAFMLRSRSELVVERPKEAAYGAVYGLMRLLTGALGATFKRGTSARLVHANATIGIRGTGVYLETRGTGTYFCTCWGTTEINVAEAPNQREIVEASHHNPRLISSKVPTDGNYFLSAPFETHTDQEMDILEKCVGRRAPWIKG